MREDNHSYLLKTIQDYGKGLLSFIRGRVKSDADAQDILQDIWYSLSLIVNTSPVEQTSAWLYKVARNKITDRYRKKRDDLIDEGGRAKDVKAIDKQLNELNQPIQPQVDHVVERWNQENAWIKEKFELRQFRTRGKANTTQEALWASITYNIQQWIRLIWRPELVAGTG